MNTTPNARLRDARTSAGFPTAIAAADALGVPRSTYIGHENGHRGFPAKRAPDYARAFGTTPEWLLYGGSGERDGAAVPPTALALPSAALLEAMLREAIRDEVTLATRIADLPRIVAPSLHAQLARYAADPGSPGSAGARTARDRAARSRAPTKRSARAG
jgi:hypothetical protein